MRNQGIGNGESQTKVRRRRQDPWEEISLICVHFTRLFKDIRHKMLKEKVSKHGKGIRGNDIGLG